MSDAEKDATPAPEVAEKPPAPQRPKMTIAEQASFMGQFCRRGRRHDNQMFHGNTAIYLEMDDFLKLEAVWQTLTVMDLHGADKMVRDKIMRERRSGGRS
jgi:hypothetical protein